MAFVCRRVVFELDVDCYCCLKEAMVGVFFVCFILKSHVETSKNTPVGIHLFYLMVQSWT
jgi:hypothetical protein